MMRRLISAGALLLAFACPPQSAAAQMGSSINPMVSVGKQEVNTLATGNVAAAALTVYGGDYIFAQACTAYGSMALQVLGPDGAAYQTLVTKTSADTAGGTGISLGSNSVVKVVLTGTTGCTALLTRLP